MPSEILTYEQMRAKRFEELARKEMERAKLKPDSPGEETQTTTEAERRALDFGDRTPSSSDERRVLQDLDDRRLESRQGHEFRGEIFAIGIFVWIGCFVIWCILLLHWPGDTVPRPAPELYYLWAFKTSLATVVLLVIGLGLMRFALRCYGHHHLQESRKESTENDALMMAVLKQTLRDGMKNWPGQ